MCGLVGSRESITFLSGLHSVQLARLPESAPVMMTVFPIIRFLFLTVAVVHFKYTFSPVRRTSRIHKTKNNNNYNDNNNGTLGLKSQFHKRIFI
jgi:hypothetical protein